MLKTLIPVVLAAGASAHQNLHQFWVNGESPGYEVGIRMPPSNNPVTDVASDDIACNVNGTSGVGVATVAAKAGDTIKVQWDSSTHPGPITHMLYGPMDSAAAASGLGDGWFKIDEQDYVDGQWANEIMMGADMTHSFQLPGNLASGEYLFYIGCAQLYITGLGGDCGPEISLPGAYKEDDANIYIPDFYSGLDPTTYKAPGGDIATCS
ncbi:glycoside hydrolase [Xylaria palmicola]|nr:glycoside hydrolase [Xylaria palmicola]